MRRVFLDMQREADSAERVRAMFAKDKSVIVPRIHRELLTKASS